MEPFTTFTAVAAPLDEANIDTDQIIPAEFLRKPRSAGFWRFLFHRRRFDANGDENPAFILNQPAFRSARILVADRNFGCGSSRESAVWAMLDAPDDPDAPGRFRAVVAPSFGDIFLNNGAKNGLLCVRLPADDCARMRHHLHRHPGSTVTIDLPAQRITGPDDSASNFDIDPFRKECLVKGVDDIDLTLGHGDALAEWEERTLGTHPWRIAL
jgi:3-isopropylmalate/(R)-2-methylmalate dehydratase small subunit